MNSIKAILVILLFIQLEFTLAKEPTTPLSDFSFVTKETIADLHLLDQVALQWSEGVNMKLIPQKTNSMLAASKSTWSWIHTVMQPTFNPSQEKVNLIAIEKGGIQDCDIIRLRYKKDTYAIQIMSSSAHLAIVIKDTSQGAPINFNNTKEIKEFVCKNIDLLFNKQLQIKKTSFGMIKKTKYGEMGGIDIHKKRITPFWENTMRWWTDGKTILFIFGKVQKGRPELFPRTEKDWIYKK